ncbi:alpha/beta hydrolase [Acetobacter sp. TBRC 12305]|uniref:Alpha/beta hydrolase n=1 Tax=Acetobacter garciniae TaxID=2817435 RepID=A0A939KMG4_9PROT|nr:lipase family protein [Acetobacter garciniae]MBO1324550.1 alpha/beta hydrolase [Acetobacter garciniae]MBX0344239.1 alpha/beta hydrolase [Acetobacter garciniae]
MKCLPPILSAVALLSLAACEDAPLPDQTGLDATSVPGTLIQSAPLDPAYSIPGAGKALSISYLSTNGVTGTGLVPVTGEVIYPAGPAPAGGWPVVAWAHGTVGIAQACAPSRNPPSSRNATYLGAWLKRGFAIVATDYQGLGGEGVHPYLNARAEAYSVLDSVRAAQKALPELDRKVLIVGQSQGAGAAFAAAAYAQTYAPTLDIRGTVATGIPYMTPQIAQALLADPGKPVGKGSGKGSVKDEPDPIVAYALLMGASEAGLNPAFSPTEAFTPKAMHAFGAASQMCLTGLLDVVKADGLTRANAFQPGLGHALAPVLQAMAYPTLKLNAPLFVGTGTADVDVAPQGQLLLVKDACQAGTTVQAHLYKGLDHSQTVLASLKDSEAFTTAVMANEPVTPSCAPTPQ